ncbi:LuxR C-terminal-related transcriptional regulator [Actinoplanes sp. NEAU-A12]|uniref:LuxR C-terminal-related transcriptional regulator n=1 Tax=Actinoplanes sandaracinus TaxID=3045177 RepID=A0ABT6WJM6_9ACTN|nr:LuxR family transcriptional regulator [Actinoplanes sandaracinus]MDI6099945.1 LuxR C-terminal-related transcriptional regulator [Actinoplanes sandaracinus]
MIDAPAVQKLGLAGRDAALAEIDRLTSAAASGRGGALVLSAGPGEGRTALLRALTGRTGWTVLTASGYADERDLPYAGLQALLAPLGDRLAELAPATREALSRAGDGDPGDPLAAGLAALSLLRTATRTRPVLCLLDDAHLLDPVSWRAIVFAVRRLGGERFAIVAAFPAGAEPPGLPVHRLAPLDPAAARLLLAAHAPDLAEDVAGTLAEIAAGNPAALIDLAAALTPEQRRGYAPPPESLPPASPLRRRLAADLEALPARTREVLLLAAAAPDTAPGTLLAAAEHGVPEPWTPEASRDTDAGAGSWGLDDFAAAERTGLVTVTPAGVRFRGPLMRAVAYTAMPVARRRSAHAALAAVLEARGARLPALLHRAAATAGPDAALARDLARAARTADPAVATQARRYAAGLCPTPAEQAGLFLDAARSAWLAGRPHQAGMLIRRIPAAGGTARVRARGLTAEMSLSEGRPGARDMLLDVAAELAESDPGTALEALALAGEAACRPDEQDRYAALARRVAAEQRGDEPPAVALTFHHVAGLARIAAHDEPGSFAPLRQAVALADRVAEPGPLLRAATAGILTGDARRAAALAGRAAVLARESGASVLVPQALELAALAAMASGDYTAAGEAALDGAAVARGTGQPVLAGAHLAVLAVLAALVGDRDTALHRIASAGDGPSRPLCEWALALLDLVDGRRPAAAERLLAVVAGPPGPGTALLRVAVVPHLLEAAAQTGARAAVEPVAIAFDRWAGHTGQPGWLALRDRCRALRADDGEAAAGHFDAALGHDGEAGFPRAHTELLYGRLLRRRRRNVEARTHLRRAAETFQSLDAGPWAAQSVRELRAAGERVEAPAPAGPALTAQQERIASLVAGGATNREVAQEMHLSPRTVDHHLRNVFARLGVRSRTEMARLLTAR